MSLDILQPGAFLVTDSHCAPWREEFFSFLQSIERGELKTSQLILMGDNFDLLFGPVSQTHSLNSPYIELLNRLSKTIEIIYLEGNHDFALQNLFPSIRVVPREHQPLRMRFGAQSVLLSHGDIYAGRGYGVYTFVIRNRIILKTLNWINEIAKGWIIEALSKKMILKLHCKKIEDFDQIVKKRIARYGLNSIDWIIEGHFHQNRIFREGGQTYFNLGAFACNERYFVVESKQDELHIAEAEYSKEPV